VRLHDVIDLLVEVVGVGEGVLDPSDHAAVVVVMVMIMVVTVVMFMMVTVPMVIVVGLGSWMPSGHLVLLVANAMGVTGLCRLLLHHSSLTE
jgi:hypothetical protein